MAIRFAINGLGRIGRALLRIALGRPGLEPVAVNDLAPAATLARLLNYDSVHGRASDRFTAEDDALRVAGRRIAVWHEPTFGAVPWEDHDAEVVVEATGLATERALAVRHVRGSVRQVLITAIAPQADATLCPGLHTRIFRSHQVLSAASCTTHALVLLLQVLDQAFGVRQAMMTEVHSYTGNQRLLDGVQTGSPRRERAAALNLVPTTTAAPTEVERLLPQFAGCVRGQAVRVPTPNVALLDLVVALTRRTDPAALHDAFCRAAADELRGLLAVSAEPLVSSDYIGDPHSATLDSLLTQSLGGELVRLVAWYDNEWGYANRLADFLTLIGDTTA